MWRKLAPVRLRDELPGDEVRVVLELGDDDDVAGAEVVEAPGVGDEVDRLGRAAREDDLALGRRVDEGARPSRARPRSPRSRARRAGRRRGGRSRTRARRTSRIASSTWRGFCVDDGRVEVGERLAVRRAPRRTGSRRAGPRASSGCAVADGHLLHRTPGRLSPAGCRGAGRSDRPSARGSRSRVPHPTAISTIDGRIRGSRARRSRAAPAGRARGRTTASRQPQSDPHEPGAARARRLEREDQVEPDDDQRRRRHRPRLDQPEVEHVEREAGRSSARRARRRRPAGTAKRATSRRKPSVRHGPSLGASARKKAGIPIVERAARVRWRGSSGYSAGVMPIERIRKTAKTDFVTNSFATRWRLRRIARPSATIAGTGGEVAVDEDDVGDRLRHLRAGPLGDREARRLQRRHVVDAVADHRHVAAAPRGAPRRPAACPPARSAR